MARGQRSCAIELRCATLGVYGAALFDGGNRHLVTDAQRVPVRRGCFRGRRRNDLPDAEPDDGGDNKRRGENETASCSHRGAACKLAWPWLDPEAATVRPLARTMYAPLTDGGYGRWAVLTTSG